MPEGTNTRTDLAALARKLSQADGDGHRWEAGEALEWLVRMGFLADRGNGPQHADSLTGGGAKDPRLQGLLTQPG